MIQRIVLAKLTDDLSNPVGRAEAVRHTREVFATIPGPLGFEVGAPADEAAIASWDLCILVRFASLSDVAAYGQDPTHRAYVDGWLTPNTVVKKAWNFEI